MAAHISPKDLEEAREWWNEEIGQGESVTTERFADELKLLVERETMGTGIDVDDLLDEATKDIKKFIEDGMPTAPHTYECDQGFDEEAEIERVFMNIFGMLDHTEPDGKIHMYEFN